MKQTLTGTSVSLAPAAVLHKCAGRAPQHLLSQKLIPMAPVCTPHSVPNGRSYHCNYCNLLTLHHDSATPVQYFRASVRKAKQPPWAFPGSEGSTNKGGRHHTDASHGKSSSWPAAASPHLAAPPGQVNLPLLPTSIGRNTCLSKASHIVPSGLRGVAEHISGYRKPGPGHLGLHLSR